MLDFIIEREEMPRVGSPAPHPAVKKQGPCVPAGALTRGLSGRTADRRGPTGTGAVRLVGRAPTARAPAHSAQGAGRESNAELVLAGRAS